MTTTTRPPVGSGRPLERFEEESVLRDAIAYLAVCHTPEERAEAYELIASIRTRFDENGWDAEAPLVTTGRLHFEHAPRHHSDPPGAVRYFAVQPDGRRGRGR